MWSPVDPGLHAYHIAQYILLLTLALLLHCAIKSSRVRPRATKRIPKECINTYKLRTACKPCQAQHQTPKRTASAAPPPQGVPELANASGAVIIYKTHICRMGLVRLLAAARCAPLAPSRPSPTQAPRPRQHAAAGRRVPRAAAALRRPQACRGALA